MAKRDPKPSVSEESFGSENLDGFSALLQKQFRPSNGERTSRIEAAVQTLAEQALALNDTSSVAAFDTVSSVIDALKQEIERRPDKRDKLQFAVDQLTELRSYMDGKDGAETLLDRILADPELLRSLSANSGLALENEVRRFPITAQMFRREVRSDKPFTRQGLADYFARHTDSGRQVTTRIVHNALAERTENTGRFIEQEFSRRVGRYDDGAFRKEVLDGSLGVLSDGDRHFIETSFDEAHAAWQNERRFILFIKDRLDESTDSLHPPSVVERTERLAAYAKEHGSEGLEDYARLLFPEWSIFQKSELPAPTVSVELPSKAPELYQGLRGPETPPDFVQRVYGEWLGHGLTRAHIRKLDSKLYDAINNWLSRPGNDWPADVDLPTLKELNDRWADRIQKEGFAAALGEGESGFALREIDRLRGVMQRRQGDGKTGTAEANGLPLPTEAPENYAGLRGPETPPVFVQRVYGEWLGHGLTRAHVRKLDPKLYESINNWLSRPGNEWPADVDLPTLKEQNTRWADRVGKEGIMSAVDGLSGQDAVREARRLANLRHRRSKEQQQR